MRSFRSCWAPSSAPVSFTGSIIAFLKLQEMISGRPITFPSQKMVNAILLGRLRSR